jgi:hypothetical protein
MVIIHQGIPGVHHLWIRVNHGSHGAWSLQLNYRLGARRKFLRIESYQPCGLGGFNVGTEFLQEKRNQKYGGSDESE